MDIISDKRKAPRLHKRKQIYLYIRKMEKQDSNKQQQQLQHDEQQQLQQLQYLNYLQEQLSALVEFNEGVEDLLEQLLTIDENVRSTTTVHPFVRPYEIVFCFSPTTRYRFVLSLQTQQCHTVLFFVVVLQKLLWLCDVAI